MAGSARVLSIESLERFRGKLCEFGKDVKDTLSAIEMQIHRVFAWLDERGKHWHREIRVRQEEVLRAKMELQSRKNMCKDGRGPGTTDQEKALRRAQARLKEAEDKLAACKKWQPQLQHAVHEYHGPARLLAGAMDTDLLHTLSLLAQKIASLEAYLAVTAPQLPPLAGTGESADTALPSAAFGQPAAAESSKETNHESEQQLDGNERHAEGSPDSLGRDQGSLERQCAPGL
jgi:hypothetical protein